MESLKGFLVRICQFAFAALICLHLLPGACSAEWIAIRTVEDLQAINTGPDGGHYRLMNDINASGFDFAPISDFHGLLEGQGFKIVGLTIDSPRRGHAALFSLNRGAIQRVGLENSNIKASGSQHAAGMAGVNHGTIGQSYVTGRVSGQEIAGGIAAVNKGFVGHCFADVNVASTGDYVGGLVGFNEGTPGSGDGQIGFSYSSGNVVGRERVGGLVGENTAGTIMVAYSDADVVGTHSLVGGLAGVSSGGSRIYRTFARGRVEGYDHVGGLVGSNAGEISQSYAESPWVQAKRRYSGGLTGIHHGDMYDSYALGHVDMGCINQFEGFIGGLTATTGGHNKVHRTYSAAFVRAAFTDYNGGLIGHKGLYSDVRRSYWDKDAAGVPFDRSAGGAKRTTSQMQRQSNYVDWDFDNVWKIDEGRGYPELRWNFSMQPFPDPPQNPEIPIDWPGIPRLPDIPDIPELPGPRFPDLRPQPPENLRAAPGDGRVALTWDESPSSGIESYRVYVRLPESLFRLQASVPADTTEYVDEGLTNNVTYIYTVRSFSNLGFESAEASNTARAVPGTDESGEDASPSPDEMPPPEGEVPDEEEDDDSSGCFIAAAAYGSCMSSEVVPLRIFRDGFLLRSRAGNSLVMAYYAASPAFAELVEGNNVLRLIARLHLAPFVKAAGWFLN